MEESSPFAEQIEHVSGFGDHGRLVHLEKVVRSGAFEPIHRAGEGHGLASVFFNSLSCGDECAGFESGLDDQNPQTQPGNDPVAAWEQFGRWACAHGELADERPAAVGDAVVKVGVFWRIDMVQPAAHHRDRSPTVLEGGVVSAGVDAAGPARNDGQARGRQVPGKASRLVHAELLHEVNWPAHGIAAYRLCLRHEPNSLDIIHRIGDLFIRHQQLSDDKPAAAQQAVAWGREVLAGMPRDPRIWDAIVGVYKEVGAVDEASELWPKILRRFRKYQVLYYNYGLFLDQQDRIDEAVRALKFALLMVPDYARASNLLSLTITHVHDLQAAIRFVRWATVSNPSQISGWLNYGSHLRATGLYTQALAAYDRAETLAKAEGNSEQVATAQFNRGMSNITIGELEVGFRLIEARWATAGFPSPKRNFRHAIWQGPQKHRNTGLLTYMEQGLGDEVMMSWYLPMLRRDTRRLVVDCDERLIDVFSRTYEGIEFVPRTPAGDDRARAPDLRHKVPIVHVPQYYVTELKTLIRSNWHWAERAGTRFPARLVLEPERLDRWDRWLEERYPGRPRLALSWRSKMHNRMRDQQYLTPEELAAALPEGTVGINLQYSSTEEETDALQELGRQRGFDFVTPEGVDLTNDLEDVFALLQVSDAAVTPMISLAWMAGAVGCPGYIFRTSRERVIWQQFGLPFVPWAPSLRLFFRDRSECWTATIRELNRTLAHYLASRPGRDG